MRSSKSSTGCPGSFWKNTRRQIPPEKKAPAVRLLC
jgi:hypothetical protein